MGRTPPTGGVIGSIADVLGRVRHARPSTLLFLAPGVVYLCIFFVYPMFLTIQTSFARNNAVGYTLDNYRDILGSSYYWDVIGLTLVLAAATTIVSIGVAVPLALVLRKRMRGHALVRVLVLAPLLILALVSALGLLIIWSNTGWMSKLIEVATGASVNVDYTVHGLIIFYVWLYAPYTILTTLAAIEGIDPAVEEAARVAGARPRQVLRRITLPLALAGIRAGSILTFLLAFEAFSIPLIAGGNHRPLAVVVYTEAAVFENFPKGSALAVIMALIAVIVLVVYQATFSGRWRSGRRA
ncbi:MAG: ABC transporter permease [Gaiellaceae bacterium MAG52_C11]|nr:ABC transporter permease [Candidatus Gaiellasilicea maunaloa]